MRVKVSSDISKDPTAIKSGVVQWILVNVVFLLALGATFFLSAGRTDWGLGWMYLGVLVVGQTATALILLVTNPTLLGERSWMQKGSKPWDIVIVSLSDAGWLLLGLAAGLDTRWGWSPRLAVGLQAFGWAALGIGLLIFLWAMACNRFFSTFVRIQANRGHAVETGGPYRYVRHPGYLGALLIYSASPLALASLWAFLPAALLFALTVYRTVREDQTLLAELGGYTEFAQRIRYRLLPGVW